MGFHFYPRFRRAVRREAKRSGFAVYDDVRNVKYPHEGMRVHLTGEVQQPAGVWWYDGEKWFSGDRTRISRRMEMGGNSQAVVEGFRLPSEMELDVWQAQCMNVDRNAGGDDSGLFIDVYSPERGEVLYEYSAFEQDGVIALGNPLATVGQDSDLLQIRLRNETGGSVTVTGFLLTSLQSVLE